MRFVIPFFRKKVNFQEVAVLQAALKFCEDLKELSKADPERSMELLTGAWGTFLSDYSEMSKGNQAREPAAMMAMVVLNAYFMHRGDWDKMIEHIKSRI